MKEGGFVRKKLFIIGMALLLIGLGLLVIGIGNNGYVTRYIVEEYSNVTFIEREREYPNDWLCVEISNAYMKKNPEWRGLGIVKKPSITGHAVNYRIEDDRLFIHDETWGFEYEFVDWRNMTLILYDWNETIPKGKGINIVNAGEWEK